MITMFTNISAVTIDGVRTFSHALLVEPERPDERIGGSAKLRGFMVCGASPTFDVFLKSAEFTREDGQSPHIFIGSKGIKPLATGLILTFKDGPTVQVVRGTYDERPICIDEFADDADYEAIWIRLTQRVAEFWYAPNMPVLAWHNATAVRRTAGKAR
jgi:hypothetical protein